MLLKKTMNGIEILTPAKVNLFLEVLRRRQDGFHDIESLMDPVSLYDRLVIEPSDSGGVEVSCAHPDVPDDDENIVARAWRALSARTGRLGGVRVTIEKNIPPGGGLGGGSSNAAGMLVGLNELFGLGFSKGELESAGAETGSDVPFFFAGRRAVVRGRGERVEPLEDYLNFNYVLIFPDVSVATKKIYNKLNLPLTGKSVNDILSLGQGYNRCRGALFNRLEESTFQLFPGLTSLKRKIVALKGEGVVMSGSGSTFVCVCSNKEEAESLRERLDEAGIAPGITAHSVSYLL